MYIWRRGTDIRFRWRSDIADVSGVAAVRCELKLSEGECLPPDEAEVKVSFAVTAVPSSIPTPTTPDEMPYWEIEGTKADSLSLEPGEYVFDVLVEFTDGSSDRSPPYRIKVPGRITSATP